MPVIEVVTRIKAPPVLCFRLALSVDLHTASTRQTREEMVGGVRSGVLKLGDSVTFRARHFGIWQTLTSKVTELESPRYFCDEMQRGAFNHMRHEHHFQAEGSTTIMRDIFTFESPLGCLGKVVDTLLLRRYLQRFLESRCAVIKHYAESGAWREVLDRPGA